MPPSNPVYLKDLVADCLAARGLAGTVEIRPRTPLATRLETGERTQFIVEYRGRGAARLVLDEWEISCGTVRAPIAETLADKLAIARRIDLAA